MPDLRRFLTFLRQRHNPLSWYNLGYLCFVLPSFVVNGVVNSKNLRHPLFAGFLNHVKNLAVKLLHFFLCILISQVCIGVQSNTYIAVSHDILKGLGIHTGLRHIGAECVSTNMGRDLRHLHLVDFVVFLANVLEIAVLQ